MKKLVWILLGICIILGLAGVAHVYYIKGYPQYQQKKKQKAEAKKFLEQLQKAESTMQQRIKTQDNPFTYPENVSPCKIEGHDCWEVVQMLKQTKTTTPTNEEINQYLESHPQITRGVFIFSKEFLQLHHYDNPELQKINISVTAIERFSDGGSVLFTLSNDGTIFRKWEATYPGQYEYTTVSFPNGEIFVFNNKGEITRHTPPQEETQNN